MKLSKNIPARVKTVHYNWCKKDFMEMSQRFRDIRGRNKHPMDKCGWCRHAFVDGEMMALAQPTNGRNHVLCQKCAEELLASKEEGKMT